MIVGINDIVAVNIILLRLNNLEVIFGYTPFTRKYKSGRKKIILETIRGIMKTKRVLIVRIKEK